LIRKLSLWGPVLLYMGVIFYLSSKSDIAIPAELSDKGWHSIGYTGFAIVIVRALAGGLPARITTTTALVAVAIATLYAVTDEFHQSFVPNRTADVQDLIADVVGAAMGAFVCWLWGILFAAPHDLEGTSRHGL
jgi:VanZ family protein